MVQVVIESTALTSGAVPPNGLYFSVDGVASHVASSGGTGLDAEVRERVLDAAGAMRLVERIAESARSVLVGYANERRRLVRVTVACRDGMRQSVAVAEAVGQYLRTGGVDVEVDHRVLVGS
ncbi:hypothetical protein ACFV4P_35405 [Kitasatospora sp. NPDC059795]|uniref:RapZ C-terminal domain-containing protein n=1 Tax=Kitasatospora sp. NPDC059795 TaxID=3346949 RepID=UPI0036694540